MIDFATKYCLAAAVTPTARGLDALGCLRRAIAEAQRLTQLDDLRADSGLMDLVDAEGTVIGTSAHAEMSVLAPPPEGLYTGVSDKDA